MQQDKKIKMLKMMLLSWFVLASCKIPDALSGLGKAIGDMFRSLASGIRFN